MTEEPKPVLVTPSPPVADALPTISIEEATRLGVQIVGVIGTVPAIDLEDDSTWPPAPAYRLLWTQRLPDHWIVQHNPADKSAYGGMGSRMFVVLNARNGWATRSVYQGHATELQRAEPQEQLCRVMLPFLGCPPEHADG